MGVYPPASGCARSTAIHMDAPAFVAWAAEWVDPADYGTGVGDNWKIPEKAMGKAQGTTYDVMCLGEGGSVTMTFKYPITNGEGWDFAVFENSPMMNILNLHTWKFHQMAETLSGLTMTNQAPDVGTYHSRFHRHHRVCRQIQAEFWHTV